MTKPIIQWSGALLCSIFICLIYQPVYAKQIHLDNLIIEEDTSAVLDLVEIAHAVAPLIDKGAYVGLFVLNTGDQAELERRLAANQWWAAGQIKENVIVIFMTADGFATLQAGEQWAAYLKPHLADIQAQHLDPNRREQAWNPALIGTLNALDQVLTDAGVQPINPYTTYAPVPKPAKRTLSPFCTGLVVLCSLLFGFLLPKQPKKKKRKNDDADPFFAESES